MRLYTVQHDTAEGKLSSGLLCELLWHKGLGMAIPHVTRTAILLNKYYQVRKIGGTIAVLSYMTKV
jgi:hypothetical protein